MTITLLISIEKIQNLCSNLSSEFALSKTFRPRLIIPYQIFPSQIRVQIVKTSIFTPLHLHIIVIRISSNSVGLILIILTLLISIEKIQNSSSSSSSKCVLSKTFSPHQKIPNRSKAVVETVTKGHFSTHSLSDYVS